MNDQQFKTWDQYKEEAYIAPFSLKVSEDEVLVFENPSGTALLRITQGLRNGDVALILSAVAGDNSERVFELLNDVGHKAVSQLVEDLMDHFGLYEPITLVGPHGGSVVAKRPTEVQKLINQGWRPAGEAPTS